jgi:hypothetical protein
MAVDEGRDRAEQDPGNLACAVGEDATQYRSSSLCSLAAHARSIPRCPIRREHYRSGFTLGGDLTQKLGRRICHLSSDFRYSMISSTSRASNRNAGLSG